MKTYLYLFFALFCFNSCSDGDVIEVGLDFDQELALCGLFTDTYFLYDIREDPFESLSLSFPITAANAPIFRPAETGYSDSFEIDGSSVRFIYRTYDGNPEDLLCSLIPDPNTTIVNSYEATSGIVTTLTTFIDDDGDGIPSSVEDENLDFDDNPATNPTDRDGDGIPDYKDADDDNDNILTRFEGVNYSIENGLSLARNTDGDALPDYLDADDDGDGTLTRYEDADLDLDPRNDRDLEADDPDLARYLNPLVNDSFQVDIDAMPISFVPNEFIRRYRVRFNLSQIDIQILSTDVIDLGEYIYSGTITE